MWSHEKAKVERETFLCTPMVNFTREMNDEDEDTYGFGSFTDLFDVGTSSTKKQLDVKALSRFCMSKRLLMRFQQHQEKEEKDQRCVIFQHVAAKFNGVGLDGGLGTLSVTSLEGGGVVWLQTVQSDSDALEKRKKELQEVTNESEKSAAVLFLAVAQVVDVLPITVQNTVQGVEMKLLDDNRLELIFMPGPFAGAMHRDEFLQELKRLMSAATSDEEAIRHERREELRRLVRKYTTLDEKSGEGLAIAKQVYAETEYHLGPMTEQTPKFSIDMEYRKKSVEKLTNFLNRMNQEWSDADLQRELHTKTKYCRNEDGLFEYTDTGTGVQIPPRVYEQRYLQYVKAHEVNPVLHLFPRQEETTQGDQMTANDSACLKSNESAKLRVMKTLGIDISSSCIIDGDFFSSKAPHTSLDIHTYKEEDVTFRAAVDNARIKLWNSWASDLASDECTIQVVGDNSEQQTQSIGSTAMRKRGRDRRRSLVLPTSDDFQSSVEVSVADSLEDSNGTTSSRGNSHPSRSKRSRSTLPKSDASRKSRRKARRQSIVSQVDLASIEIDEAEEKATAKNCRSPRKSPQSRHVANRHAHEVSSLEMVEDEEDSDLCRLCYSDQALVLMTPCDHAVCSSCWSRLSPASEKNQTNSCRVCPWDREVVTKRK